MLESTLFWNRPTMYLLHVVPQVTFRSVPTVAFTTGDSSHLWLCHVGLPPKSSLASFNSAFYPRMPQVEGNRNRSFRLWKNVMAVENMQGSKLFSAGVRSLVERTSMTDSTVTKADLIEEVVRVTDLPRKEPKAVVETIFES